MASYSEYAPLERVILGSVDEYKPACWAWKSVNNVTPEGFSQAQAFCDSAIPNEILDEVSEDLLNYASVLKKLGVEVIRPPRIGRTPILETEFFYSYGRDLYNMRDLHIVFGSRILASAPSQPNRIAEIADLREFLVRVSRESDLEYIQSPSPTLKSDPVYPNVRNAAGDLVSAEEALAPRLGSITQEIWHRLTEDEVLFDAANIVRSNDSALYLISSTGNAKAFRWLHSIIPDFDFQQTDVYRSSHIDSTILPLDPDTYLVNSVRVNSNNLPDSLKGKRILFFEDVASIPPSEINFHREYRAVASSKIEALGFQTNLSEMSSPWAGMNVLSINQKTILVEANQVHLMHLLEANGYEVIPIKMRHAYTMLGGLHCTTLDLVRSNS